MRQRRISIWEERLETLIYKMLKDSKKPRALGHLVVTMDAFRDALIRVAKEEHDEDTIFDRDMGDLRDWED